jgi:hypothetical protein
MIIGTYNFNRDDLKIYNGKLFFKVIVEGFDADCQPRAVWADPTIALVLTSCKYLTDTTEAQVHRKFKTYIGNPAPTIQPANKLRQVAFDVKIDPGTLEMYFVSHQSKIGGVRQIVNPNNDSYIKLRIYGEQQLILRFDFLNNILEIKPDVQVSINAILERHGIVQGDEFFRVAIEDQSIDIRLVDPKTKKALDFTVSAEDPMIGFAGSRWPVRTLTELQKLLPAVLDIYANYRKEDS